MHPVSSCKLHAPPASVSQHEKRWVLAEVEVRAAFAPLALLTSDSEYVDRTDDDKHSGAPYVIPSFPTDAPCRTCFGLPFHSTLLCGSVSVEPCQHSTVTFLPFLQFVPTWCHTPHIEWRHGQTLPVDCGQPTRKTLCKQTSAYGSYGDGCRSCRHVTHHCCRHSANLTHPMATSGQTF